MNHTYASPFARKADRYYKRMSKEEKKKVDRMVEECLDSSASRETVFIEAVDIVMRDRTADSE